MAKNIMIQGTASSVGKSIIAAGLCRVFAEDGYSVSPFKSQNMALNSFVTSDGCEMGRAQVLQAQASFKEPSVLMNPVLLKPSSETGAQVILMGKVQGTMSAADYQTLKPSLKGKVLEVYRELETMNDVIVLEGAGSPAEINLREHDIVNMGMAELVDAPVLLVADIDRGGVFASVVGTIFLLSEDEKNRVKGIIINKFRGDRSILQPGIEQLEQMVSIPVVGVMPYFDVRLEDEDSVTERFSGSDKNGAIDVCVIRTPWISNFTDFDIFYHIEDLNFRYAASAEEIGEPDLIIIPGSKNTIADMQFLRSSRIDNELRRLHSRKTIIAGICGGFQMLGSRIEDPHSVEGLDTSSEGLSLINMTTVLERDKITAQVKGTIAVSSGELSALAGTDVAGYEIHMGRSVLHGEYAHLAVQENGKAGVVHENIFGTYMHGIFDSSAFTGALVNLLRKRKNLPAIDLPETFGITREKEFAKLSAYMRRHLDMKKIYSILDGDDARAR